MRYAALVWLIHSSALNQMGLMVFVPVAPSGNNICLKYQNVPAGKSALNKNHSVSLIQPFVSYV